MCHKININLAEIYVKIEEIGSIKELLQNHDRKITEFTKMAEMRVKMEDVKSMKTLLQDHDRKIVELGERLRGSRRRNRSDGN